MSFTKLFSLSRLLPFTAFLFINHLSFSATCTAILNNGSWCSGSTWDVGHMPEIGDNIVIPAGINVLINCHDNNVHTGNLSVYGTLTFSNGKGIKMDIYSTVIVGAGALFTGGNNGSGLWIGTSVETDCTVYQGDSGITTIGPATCTFMNCCNMVALSVELSSFSGFVDEKGKTHLNWSTASEKDNDYFSIEISTDGLHFDRIAEMKGAGNSSQIINYQWTNDNAKPGISYYRLIQTDINGLQTTFNPISVINNLQDEILLVPNPTAGNTNIYFKSEKEQLVKLEIYDFYGHLVSSSETSIYKGGNTLEIQSDLLNKGSYAIKLKMEEQHFISRFIKL